MIGPRPGRTPAYKLCAKPLGISLPLPSHQVIATVCDLLILPLEQGHKLPTLPPYAAFCFSHQLPLNYWLICWRFEMPVGLWWVWTSGYGECAVSVQHSLTTVEHPTSSRSLLTITCVCLFIMVRGRLFPLKIDLNTSFSQNRSSLAAHTFSDRLTVLPFHVEAFKRFRVAGCWFW